MVGHLAHDHRSRQSEAEDGYSMTGDNLFYYFYCSYFFELHRTFFLLTFFIE